ncbi:uncharacterized mitochondrial protein AtMg00810-like [Lycium ferocissimum]|uniref:uncharacterized mitochondrial protein AtMg00810-like n=1 Tax=Lycium ferocissimum TaxID=112874 RepID=UPI002814CF67|nr:uncharacterized mitochondrial protein AtMg00810-like [Lycium ferocissimum]
MEQLPGFEDPIVPNHVCLLKKALYRSKQALKAWFQKFSSYLLHLDADWAGCPLTRRSTTGLCVFLGSNCISWFPKKQNTVTKSSAKVEYRSLASLAAELTWVT